MKKGLFLLFFLPLTAWSQGGFSLYAYQSFSRFDTAGINRFFRSFNDFWSNDLEEPFEGMRGREFSHPDFGAGFRVAFGESAGFTAGTGFLIGGRNVHRYCTWGNGVQNHLRMRVRDVQWTFNAGVHFRSLIYLEGYMGANSRNLRFEYTTIYQDGSESISPEYKLNGLYTGTVASLDYGLQVGARFRVAMLTLRLTWPFGNFPPGKGLVPLDDYSTNNFPATTFPSDYNAWATDVIRYTEESLDLKTDDFEGPRITVGIEFIFGAQPK